MAIELTFDLQTADGRSADAMQEIIAIRHRELGETTINSCKAIAINVLKSLRADTKLANEKNVDLQVTCVDGQLWPSWKREGKVSKRVLRAGKSGAEVTPKRVTWICAPYTRGEVVHSYRVIDRRGGDNDIEYILVANDEKQARDFAKQKRKARIHRHKGLAKVALGIAMHKVSASERDGAEAVTEAAKSLGARHTFVNVMDTGFDSGQATVHIHDALGYAADALKHGAGYVETAVQLALNKMMAYLKHKLRDRAISEKIHIPFPEISKQ